MPTLRSTLSSAGSRRAACARAASWPCVREKAEHRVGDLPAAGGPSASQGHRRGRA